MAQYEVGLPNKQAREDILKVILARHGRDMGEECVSAELLKVGCTHCPCMEHTCRGLTVSDLLEARVATVSFIRALTVACGTDKQTSKTAMEEQHPD